MSPWKRPITPGPVKPSSPDNPPLPGDAEDPVIHDPRPRPGPPSPGGPPPYLGPVLHTLGSPAVGGAQSVSGSGDVAAPGSLWAPVTSDGRLSAGTYRIVGTLRGPYNAVVLGSLHAALAIKLASQGAHLERLDAAAPLWNDHDNTLGPWPFVARFTVPSTLPPAAAGLDGRSVLLILTLVAGVALGFSIVSSRVERLLEKVGAIVTPPLAALLSPGTIILAVLAIFLITRSRGGGS